MSKPRSDKAGRMLTSWLLAVAVMAPVATRRLAAQPDPHARTLVVKIMASRPGAQLYSIGSGIVVGVDGRSVYIATARHVLEEALDTTGAVVGDLRVVFAWDSGGSEPDRMTLPQARLVRAGRPDAIDLAIISVARGAIRAGSAVHWAFDRQGHAREGDRVYPVGCALEGIGCWEVPPLPDKVAIRNDRLLRFQTGVTAGGHSGGALFNEWGEVVGMITSVDRQFGTALSIEHVLATIRSWGYRWVQLRKSNVPRAGHRWTVGFSYLAPLGADPVLSQSGLNLDSTLSARLPSGRLTISRRLYSSARFLLSGHVAGLRLAPKNLAIGAALVGVQADVRMGPVAVGAFGEVGLGHVQSRYDAPPGGFLISDPSGTSDQYVPFWNRVEGDGAGAGVGFHLALTLTRFLILQGTVGHWGFNMPEKAQNVPDLFAGGGIQIGR